MNLSLYKLFSFGLSKSVAPSLNQNLLPPSGHTSTLQHEVFGVLEAAVCGLCCPRLWGHSVCLMNCYFSFNADLLQMCLNGFFSQHDRKNDSLCYLPERKQP